MTNRGLWEDSNSGQEVVFSEVDMTNRGLLEDSNSGHEVVFSEVDMTNRGLLEDSNSGHEVVFSEVDMTNRGLLEDSNSGQEVVFSEVDMTNQVPRGRKRRRAHFTDDADLDSSFCSNGSGYVASYIKGRKRNKASLELSAILRMKCCKYFCLHKVSRSKVFKSRVAFQSKSKTEQRQWILQHLHEHHETSGATVTYMFNIGTTHLCQRGWRLALGVKKTRMWHIKHDFENVLTKYMGANFHKRGMQTPKVLNPLAWLRDFANRFGEKLPTCDKIHLPSCLTRSSIYNLMHEELASNGEEVCSQTHFFRMWRKQMAHINIPKVNRFSKCDICTTLKTSIEKTTDKLARQNLYQQRETHLTQQKTERQKYYKHITKARRDPQKYMSMIIDGMDQKATSIPRFYRSSKSTSAAWKLQSHITGTLLHGRGTHIYVDLKEYKHDSNLTANILLNILQRYSDTIPDILYLQMDNCGRENKNQCVIGLCALLVELNVFRKVKIGFLMKGHTHEDVDQLFSRISVHTGKKNLPTLSSLINCVPQAYNKPNTTCERLTSIHNIRDWMQPQINKPSQHSHPHQFRITKNAQGKAVLHTKKWSSSIEWQATTGEEYIIKAHPEGTPDLVVPKCDDLYLHNLRRDMSKYKPYLTTEEMDEWDELMNSLEAGDDDQIVPWMLTDILMGKDAQINVQEPVHQDNACFSNDEQTPILPVNLGPKQRQEKTTTLKVGNMVGVFLEEHRNEWPQVGKVTAIQADNITVHWYLGTTTSTWTSINRPAHGRRGIQEPFIETIPSASIITHPFNLTGTAKLPQDVQRHLKEKHEEFYFD